MVPFPMILSDLQPRFQGLKVLHALLTHNRFLRLLNFLYCLLCLFSVVVSAGTSCSLYMRRYHLCRYQYNIVICDHKISAISISISNNRIGLTVWLVLLSTVCSQQPVLTHPSPQLSTLLCWGDWWMGTGCWYSGLPHCSGSTHHSNLKQLMIPYQLLQQAGRATWCDPATCGLCRHRYALGMLALTHTFSRVTLLTHKLHVGYLCR